MTAISGDVTTELMSVIGESDAVEVKHTSPTHVIAPPQMRWTSIRFKPRFVR
jgi:hypothetical protein